jgi:cytochrome c peroxidase
MSAMKKQSSIVLGLVVLFSLAFTSCKREAAVYTVSDSELVPKLPDQVYDYPVSSNDYLATLGRVLFYDKELSQNHNISCASCHKQESAFADDDRFSKGTNAEHTDRNTSSIFPKNGRLFWDGRASNLMDLVFRPIRNKVEMNVSDLNSLMDRISTLDYYAYMFKHAYPGMTRVDSNMIKSAISEFLRNFTFSNTKFALSQRNEIALTQQESDGKNLFFGKALCSSCHHIDGGNNFNGPGGMGGGGYGFTDESHNIGLDSIDTDKGVGKITNSMRDMGAFMMPVLLNVENTAPYMHDGRFKTLEEVVEHYNSGIKDNANLDLMLRTGREPIKLNLTNYQKAALVSFLKTLTDPSITKDPKFSDPFVPRTN